MLIPRAIDHIFESQNSMFIFKLPLLDSKLIE